MSLAVQDFVSAVLNQVCQALFGHAVKGRFER